MMMTRGNGISVSESDPTQRIMGWSRSSRALLVSVCLVGSLLLGRTQRRAESGNPRDVRLVVDPNNAPPGVLMALPRLGPALVGRIVVQRDIEPFDSVEDLDRRVKGIGPATIKSVRPYLKVETRSLKTPK